MSSALQTESTKLRNENCTIHAKRTPIDIVIFKIFKIKWPKSEEKINFGGRWVWLSESSPTQTSWCWHGGGPTFAARLRPPVEGSVCCEEGRPPYTILWLYHHEAFRSLCCKWTSFILSRLCPKRKLLRDSSSNSYRTEVTLSLPEVKSPGEVRTELRYGFIELSRSYREKGAGVSGYGEKSMSG